jgi:hypothetical protein
VRDADRGLVEPGPALGARLSVIVHASPDFSRSIAPFSAAYINVAT